MDTITITAYSFEELSPQAQLRAIDAERCNRYEHETPWASEYMDSLKAFCDAFSIELGYHYEDVFVNTVQSDGHQDTITGLRLRTWLLNNVYDLLHRRKRYYKTYTGKRKVSRITMEQADCVFTGFCADDDLMHPIREFIAKPKAGYDLKDLLEDCIHEWNKACRAEREHYMSDEAIREDLNFRDTKYTEEGTEIYDIYIR